MYGQIDSSFIKAERRKRGWSQEQLAQAAGLGIRTIQRVETSGTASNETTKCLAAVFEVPLTRLIVEKSQQRTRVRIWAATATLFAALVSSLLLVSRANATDVAMLVAIGTDDGGKSRMNLQLKDGQQTEIKLDKELRLLLTPKLQKDGTVFVSAEVYGWDGAAFKLAGKPRVLMRIGAETNLQLDLGNGHTAKISITPKPD
jgi:transcriptional regulator with XRE-family HTH domain